MSDHTIVIILVVKIFLISYTSIQKKKIKKIMNEIQSLVVMWMDLESVIQSEVSQKEKNKHGY